MSGHSAQAWLQNKPTVAHLSPEGWNTGGKMLSIDDYQWFVE
jgi:hypothetical protein